MEIVEKIKYRWNCNCLLKRHGVFMKKVHLITILFLFIAGERWHGLFNIINGKTSYISVRYYYFHMFQRELCMYIFFLRYILMERVRFLVVSESFYSSQPLLKPDLNAFNFSDPNGILWTINICSFRWYLLLLLILRICSYLKCEYLFYLVLWPDSTNF